MNEEKLEKYADIIARAIRKQLIKIGKNEALKYLIYSFPFCPAIFSHFKTYFYSERSHEKYETIRNRYYALLKHYNFNTLLQARIEYRLKRLL